MIHFFRRISRKLRTKSIALVSLSSASLYSKIESAFISSLIEYAETHKLNKYIQFEILSGKDRKDELEKIIQTELPRNFHHLIFSVGTSATMALKRWNSERHNRTPIVFCAADNGLRAELMNDIHSRRTFTGLFSLNRKYKEQIEQLLLVKKDIKKAAIICNDTIFFNGEMEEAYQTFKDNCIETIKVSFSDVTDLKNNIKNRLNKELDVVLLLRDCISMSGIDHFVKFCNENKILLYASDVESVRKGAALGYADYDLFMGNDAAQKAIPLLFKGKFPYQLPTSIVPWHNKFFINPYTFSTQAQNIDLQQATVAIVVLN